MSLDFISIIVPAHNEEKYLSQCLTSLLNQDYPSDKYEIILVNNNSTDGTQKIAESFKIITIHQKTGPVGAVRNAGAAQAQGTLLAFIDADCVAPKNWLSTGFELMNNGNTACGGGCDLRPKPLWLERAWLLKTDCPPKDLLGACIIINKNSFFSIGGFDEKITSGEDTKLTVSLKRKGQKVTMHTALNVIHLGNPIKLSSFFTRQVWHSENYLQNLADSVKDPTFYLVIAFISSAALSISFIILKNPIYSMAFLAITLITPLALSAKRLSRSKHFFINLCNLPSIYLLDLTYISARVIGLSKSFLKILKKHLTFK